MDKPHATRTNSTRTAGSVHEEKTVQNPKHNWTFLRRRRVCLTNQLLLVIRSDQTWNLTFFQTFKTIVKVLATQKEQRIKRSSEKKLKEFVTSLFRVFLQNRLIFTSCKSSSEISHRKKNFKLKKKEFQHSEKLQVHQVENRELNKDSWAKVKEVKFQT